MVPRFVFSLLQYFLKILRTKLKNIEFPKFLIAASTMKKVVIKVCMNDDTTRFYCFGPQSSRCKAMRVATGFAGVQSVALVGDDKDQIEVVGERVDAVKLTTLLRKNVGFAEIVTVGEANENKDTAPQPVIWSYVGGVPHREIAYVMDPYPRYSEPSCSIM